MQTCPNDLSTYRGDTFSLALTFKDNDGVPYDITGWEVFFTAKRKKSDPDSEAILSTMVDNHSNPTAGETSVAFSDTEMSVIPLGTYYFDIQTIDDQGTVTTPLEGRLTVNADITRRVS